MDHRELARPVEGEDHAAMVLRVWLENDETEELVEIPAKYDVCPTCDGRGRYVNPSIDSHGLSHEDFAEDPDFAEDYHAGMYDIQCAECRGRRVVLIVDEDRADPAVVGRYGDKLALDADYAMQRAHERRMGY